MHAHTHTHTHKVNYAVLWSILSALQYGELLKISGLLWNIKMTTSTRNGNNPSKDNISFTPPVPPLLRAVYRRPFLVYSGRTAVVEIVNVIRRFLLRTRGCCFRTAVLVGRGSVGLHSPDRGAKPNDVTNITQVLCNNTASHYSLHNQFWQW